MNEANVYLLEPIPERITNAVLTLIRTDGITFTLTNDHVPRVWFGRLIGFDRAGVHVHAVATSSKAKLAIEAFFTALSTPPSADSSGRSNEAETPSESQGDSELRSVA